MKPLKFFFNEAFIQERLLPYDSPSRLSLDGEGFLKSAILFLIIPYEDRSYDLVLIKRTIRENDKHSGEISFPGGKFDPQFDKTFQDTALRECEEELGIPQEKITLLGSFDDHITPKGFIITPFVGFISETQKMQKQEEEVHEIVKIPVSFFANKKNYQERTYLLNNELIAVGKYNYHDLEGKKYVIFGATSHLIVHYIQMIYRIPLMKEGSRRLTCNDITPKLTKFIDKSIHELKK